MPKLIQAVLIHALQESSNDEPFRMNAEKFSDLVLYMHIVELSPMTNLNPMSAISFVDSTVAVHQPSGGV